VRQSFNLLGFLDNIQRQNIFVGLINAGLKFLSKLEQFVGVFLDFRLAFLVPSFLEHTRHPLTGVVITGWCSRDVSLRGWSDRSRLLVGDRLALAYTGYQEEKSKESGDELSWHQKNLPQLTPFFADYTLLK
jgi:hypothetical protein